MEYLDPESPTAEHLMVFEVHVIVFKEPSMLHGLPGALGGLAECTVLPLYRVVS
jgi:hypothetical protein